MQTTAAFCTRIYQRHNFSRQLTNAMHLGKLADLSEVPIRTIQQYEQQQKNINNAQARYLVMLAQTLCCDASDLLDLVEQKRTE